MKSLRRRLLLSMWIAVLVVGAGSAAIAYSLANHEAKELLDGELTQVAAIIAARAGGAPAVTAKDDDIEVAVWNPDGELEYTSLPQMILLRDRRPGFTEALLGHERYRVYTTIAGGHRIDVAQPVDTREDQAEAAALASLMPAVFLLPVLALVLAFVVRTLLQPMGAVADAVSRRNPLLRERLETSGLPLEIAPFVEEINRLLERQSDAVERERQFIADAAHALRTPLAALQLQADVLEGSDDPLERAARVAELRAGVQRATRLSEQLLALARTASSPAAPDAGEDVETVLREVRELYVPASHVAGVAVRLDLPAGVAVQADPRRLTLIFGNLLDNALRYTPTGGEVEIKAQACGPLVRIEIRDQGPGLPQGELVHVFERFHRAAGDRSTGSGLGLATVASLVKELGGRVSLQNRRDRSGLVALVTLPLAGDSGASAPAAAS